MCFVTSFFEQFEWRLWHDSNWTFLKFSVFYKIDKFDSNKSIPVYLKEWPIWDSKFKKFSIICRNLIERLDNYYLWIKWTKAILFHNSTLLNFVWFVAPENQFSFPFGFFLTLYQFWLSFFFRTPSFTNSTWLSWIHYEKQWL